MTSEDPSGRHGRDVATATRRSSPRLAPVAGYVASLTSAVVATCLGFYVVGRSMLADVVMLYLLGIVVVAMRYGYGPSLAATLLSVLGFDFFFIPPYYTFAVAEARHLVTFGVMLVVAIVISELTARVRAQAAAAGRREKRTASLYAMSRDLAATKTLDEVVGVAARHVGDFAPGLPVVVVSQGTGDTLDPSGVPGDEGERRAALLAWEHGRAAIAGAPVVPGVRGVYLPLLASGQRVGIVGVIPEDPELRADAERLRHLEALADLIATAIERARLADAARTAELRVQAEYVKNTLLSSFSHDLRTPLAVVTGAASTLLETDVDAATRRELSDTILVEARRLTRLVQNLLAVARVEAGALHVHKQWEPIEEVIGAALNRAEPALGDRAVNVSLPEGLTLVPLDSVLVEQVLVNLLENAARYAPSGPIDVSARLSDGAVEIEVADRGPGVPVGEEELIFEKFHRARSEGGGAGLGLAICRGIVAAHGGRIGVVRRDGGGASFRFTLPIEGEPPRLDTREPPGDSPGTEPRT